MMKAARHAIDIFPSEKCPFLIGVTILTSLDEKDLRSMGMSGSVEENVLRLAENAKNCGLDGVVCSAHEAVLLRKKLGNDFLLVTPGIRLENKTTDDQK